MCVCIYIYVCTLHNMKKKTCHVVYIECIESKNNNINGVNKYIYIHNNNVYDRNNI